jgi:two-component system sensor histidine kinase PilS (NtrC family)
VTAAQPEPSPTRTAAPDLILARRLQWALLGRLAIATTVLGGTLLFSTGTADAFTARAMSWLIVAAYAMSAASAFAIARGGSLESLGVVQVLTDLVLAGGLVYLTGGARSGFTFLFGASVLVTALVGSGRSATLVAGTTLVLYGTIAVGLANGGIPGPPDQTAVDYAPGGAELANALLRNLVGLVLVGGLAASLGDRLHRTSSELVRVTESAAGYAKRHEDIVRSLSSGLVVIGAARTIESANPAAATILGSDRPEALLGEPLDRFLDVSDSPSERRECTGRRLDGSSFPAGFTRAPLRSADGSVQGSFVVFQDLTELTALRKKAERADRLAVLGSLAAGLAHEIRNPLGSISGSVELVRDGASLVPEDRRLLDTVLKETDRLNELVTTMLEVGRAGPAERVRTPVGPIAREVIELARHQASETTVDLSISPDEGASGVIDPQQIRQVIWNLVRNALQFSPAGGVVRVRVESDETALTVEVSDEGPGIDAADRERIFDMFFTRRRRGLGLGLALSKQIVEAHQGEIVAIPNEPRGSVFRVRIPHSVERARDRLPSEPPPSDLA